MSAGRPGSPRGFAFTCPRVEALSGQGPVLDCDHCQREVHDLSALTRDEALAVLAAPRAPCVRLTVGLDGRAIFRAPAPPVPPVEPPSATPRSRPRRGGLALSGVLVGALAAGAAAASPPAVPSTVCDGTSAPATNGGPAVILADAAARLAAVVAQAERDAWRARRPRRFRPSDRPPKTVRPKRGPWVVGGEVMDRPRIPPERPMPARPDAQREPSRPPVRGAGVLPDEW